MAYFNMITLTGKVKTAPQKTEGSENYSFVLENQEEGTNYKTGNSWKTELYIKIEAYPRLIEQNETVDNFDVGTPVLIEGTLATIPMQEQTEKFDFNATYIKAKKIIKVD